jgi:hypothetical protein
VVTGDPPAADYSIQVTWDRQVSLLPLAYPAAGETIASQDGSLRVSFKGAGDTRLLLLARFEAPKGVTIGVTIVTEKRAPTRLAKGLEIDRGAAYQRGMLARLVREPGERVVVFRGSSEVAAAPEEEKVDERQIEALRALGYVP